ncbi:MAG: dehydrogenase [Planctomycetota bacterium]|nr:MAG: dehydrogenase [Planctomycetota bacterium]
MPSNLSTTLALLTTFAALAAATSAPAGEPAPPHKPLKIGIIGLDTSHAIAFAKQLNAEPPEPELAGCRVAVAYPQGSRDIESSTSRVPEYTRQVEALGVEIVDSIDALIELADAVMLESNDGRVHLEQAVPVLKAGKPLFVDKPMAASLADVMAIFAAAEHFGTPVFSSSSLRYGKGTLEVRGGSIGDVLGCDTHSPCYLEATHPDLMWYGVHGVESLFTVMGVGCESVSRTHTADADLAVGLWRGGRIGSFRGTRTGAAAYGGLAFGAKGNQPVGSYDGYEPLVRDIVRFFRGGPPAVTSEETIEIFAFMEAADESKRRGGAPVALAPILEQARAAAEKKRSW